MLQKPSKSCFPRLILTSRYGSVQQSEVSKCSSDIVFPQEWVQEKCASSWHMSGTVCMGVNNESACVDSNFRVFGLDNLRVVDLSVCPFVPK